MRVSLSSAVGIGVVASFLFVGCSRAPRPISAEELLRRTVVANLDRDSTEFSLSAQFQLETLSGSLIGSGSLADGGAAWTWEGDVSLARSRGGSFERLRGRAAYAQSKGRRLLFIHEASGLLADEIRALAPAGSFTGTWIDLGAGAPGAAVPSHTTPDPSFVERLIGTFDSLGEPKALRREHGYDYALSVRFASGATSVLGLEGSGELLIDASSFRLREVAWFIERAALPLGDLRLSLALRLFDRRILASLPITHSGSLTIPLESLLHTIFGSTLVP